MSQRHAAFERNINFGNGAEYIPDFRPIVHRHGADWDQASRAAGAVGVTDEDPARGGTVIGSKYRPFRTPGLLQRALNVPKLRRCAQHDVLMSECEAGAGHKAAVRGPSDQHKDLAARKNPFLPGFMIGPHGSNPQQRGEILGCHVLVPLILKGVQIE
jgi:hypothetical protein